MAAFLDPHLDALDLFLLGLGPEERNEAQVDAARPALVVVDDALDAPPHGAAAPAAKAATKTSRGDRLSGLDAAAKVLASTKQSMRCKDIVETMAKRGLWKSAKGKTPAATIHAAMIREIAKKKGSSRFRKAGRGFSGGVYEDAMTEYHALREKGPQA